MGICNDGIEVYIRKKLNKFGRVAQLVERSSYTRMAGGSNPSTPTNLLVRIQEDGQYKKSHTREIFCLPF